MRNIARVRTRGTRKLYSEIRRDERKRRFIEALKKRGFAQHACVATGIPRRTVYNWYESDEKFARAWDDAVDWSTELAEGELFRRGVEGYDHPVVYEGEITEYYKKYSDAALRLLLQSRKPDVYRDRKEVKHDGELLIVWDLPMPSNESGLESPKS